MSLEPRMWIDNCSKCNGRWAGHVKPAYSKAVEYVRADDVEKMILAERERCATIVHNHQIAFASDACGWALDKINDGLPADAIR